MANNPFEIKADVIDPYDVKEWIEKQYEDSHSPWYVGEDDSDEWAYIEWEIAVDQLKATKKAINFLRKISYLENVIRKSVNQTEAEEFFSKYAHVDADKMPTAEQERKVEEAIQAISGVTWPKLRSLDDVLNHVENDISSFPPDMDDDKYHAKIAFSHPHYVRRVAKHAWDLLNNSKTSHNL